ncbi:MAG TPA: SDR family oxidoreductase [Solirubrobacterales bacterium]|nr:SDR family oxidoreductase [Solirubrobacterales bacterium]
MSGLRDKVVIVTGASSGLGARFVRVLVEAGAQVAAAARREERLRGLAAEVGADRVLTVVCDVTDPADRKRLVASTVERFGRLDGLVNNAGTSAMGPALRLEQEVFAGVIETNLNAPFALSCLAATRMRENGGGSIVNVASAMAMRSIDQLPDAAYIASKAGLVGLTRELASQWGRFGIRVNALAPGFFTSEMTDELSTYEAGSYPGWLLEQIPLGRTGGEGDLDQALLLLLGDGGVFISGQALTVDGGMVTR